MEYFAIAEQIKTIRLPEGPEIAYVDEGEGQPLVFIHGLASYQQAWRKNIEVLKTYYRCIALDLPGYGQSEKGAFTISMKFFARTVGLFLEALELEKVVLVGHSMGGQIAMKLVLEDPGQIERLLLTAPAGFETFNDLQKEWLRNLYTPSLIRATSREQIRNNFESNFYQMPAEAEFMIEDRYTLFDDPEALEYYSELIAGSVLAMLDEPVFDRLSEISLPTLIVFGENDLLIPNRLLHPGISTRQVARRGLEAIPGSQLKMITRAGHFVQFERAGVYNELVKEFAGFYPELDPAHVELHIRSFLQHLHYTDLEDLPPLFHEEMSYYNPIFGSLNRSEMLAMWQMIAEQSAADLEVEVREIKVEKRKGIASWDLTYRFGPDNRLLKTAMDSTFEFRDGLIYQQRDELDFWTWASNAYGWTGWLFGWLPYYRHRKQKQNREGLHHLLI